MYSGSSPVALDNKGRISMPARFRELLFAECEGQLVLAAFRNDVVQIMPLPVWEADRERFAETLDYYNPQHNQSLELLYATADPRQLDKQGRVAIVKSLRDHAGLERDGVLRGMNDRLELMSPGTFEKRLANLNVVGVNTADQ